MKKITPLLILLITLIGCSKSQDVLVSENDDEQIVQVKETDNSQDEADNSQDEANSSVDESATPPIEATPPCTDDLENPVIFRVINELDVPVDNVMIAGLEFGNLKPNETSCYLSAKTVENIIINKFSVVVDINDQRYFSLSCDFLCGTGPYPIYEYTSGKFTMKLVSIYDEYGMTCLRVKEITEETPVFTERQGG